MGPEGTRAPCRGARETKIAGPGGKIPPPTAGETRVVTVRVSLVAYCREIFILGGAADWFLLFIETTPVTAVELVFERYAEERFTRVAFGGGFMSAVSDSSDFFGFG